MDQKTLPRKEAITAHWPAGKEASLGESGHRYERHCPEQMLLYQLVEEYYPAFVTQLAAQRRVPAQRPKSVAEGELKSEMGVTKPTGKKKRTHRSWWLPEGIDPSPVFNIVAPPFQPEGA